MGAAAAGAREAAVVFLIGAGAPVVRDGGLAASVRPTVRFVAASSPPLDGAKRDDDDAAVDWRPAAQQLSQQTYSCHTLISSMLSLSISSPATGLVVNGLLAAAAVDMRDGRAILDDDEGVGPERIDAVMPAVRAAGSDARVSVKANYLFITKHNEYH